MKRILIPSLAVVVAIVAGGAYAATVKDTVKSVDAKTHMVTLADGKAFVFPSTYDLTKVKVGEKVEITYEMKAGKNDATKIVAEK